MSPTETICWFIGIVSAIAFAVNLGPQLIKSLKTKETGLSYGFFVLAFVGNVGSAIFVLSNNLKTGEWQWPLYGNYATALILTIWLFILRIKYKK